MTLVVWIVTDCLAGIGVASIIGCLMMALEQRANRKAKERAERRPRWQATVVIGGATHVLTFDGTLPSRLAVLHLAMRPTGEGMRQ